MFYCYRYIPGAGDDEETWAQGLTPGMFWKNLETLLTPGPIGISERVAELVQLPQLSAVEQLTTLHCTTRAASAVDSIAQSRDSTPVATDQHHLKPEGCSMQLPQHMHEVGTGAHLPLALLSS